MNKQSRLNEMSDVEHFEALESAYGSMQKELPSPELDKQILAAAYREIQQPNKRKAPQISWWKRLSLPLYVAASFALTVVATNFFWPKPAKMLPGTSPGPVKFEVKSSNSTIEKTSPPKRTAIKLPEPVDIMPPPKSKLQDSPIETSSGHDGLQQQKVDTLNGMITINDVNHHKSQKSSNSDQEKVAKLSYPDQDEWAREIINLYKKGDYKAGKKSLVKFKKVYPGYPIDEQLEVIR
ncbi:hypothetical protein [Aliikangiella sp. IMCC44359]|uniref:hypothetical protein n=1 Tax=Aliikangiella sp. IMCC44359 TaxID=3459125 RepID=UPI00403AB8B0